MFSRRLALAACSGGWATEREYSRTIALIRPSTSATAYLTTARLDMTVMADAASAPAMAVTLPTAAWAP